MIIQLCLLPFLLRSFLNCLIFLQYLICCLIRLLSCCVISVAISILLRVITCKAILQIAFTIFIRLWVLIFITFSCLTSLISTCHRINKLIKTALCRLLHLIILFRHFELFLTIILFHIFETLTVICTIKIIVIIGFNWFSIRINLTKLALIIAIKLSILLN